MKDKEMIEEMAKIINGSTEIDTMSYYKALNKAKELYAQNYRKLPENAFILTDDNVEEVANLIVTSPQMQSAMSDLIETWQKETAREILSLYRLSDTFSSFQDKVVKLYGVEIKETVK